MASVLAFVGRALLLLVSSTGVSVLLRLNGEAQGGAVGFHLFGGICVL